MKVWAKNMIQGSTLYTAKYSISGIEHRFTELAMAHMGAAKGRQYVGGCKCNCAWC